MRARSLLALLLIGGVVGCSKVGKQFAYVTGPGTPEIFQFQLHSNGSLSGLSPENSSAGTSPVTVVIHPSGDFAYIANFAGNTVTLLSVNQGNGQLAPPAPPPIPPPTPGNIFNTGPGPIAIAIAPNGAFLYALNQGSGNIAAFTVDPTSGDLTAIPPPGNPPPSPFFGSIVGPTSMAINPAGTFLYVASPTQHTVSCFAISSKGLLAEVAGSPFNVGTSPKFVAIEPQGRFLYVADPGSNSVLGFSIQSSGALTAINGSPFPASSQPVAITITPGGALLFAANQGSNNVSAYVIDAGSGALGTVSGSPFPTGGRGPVSLASSQTFLYVAENITNDVAALAIGNNGTLTPVANSPFSVATQPSWIAVNNTQ
jgi:6-phosphogluconolactonase (cycloisomerase 2 family)